MIKKILLLMLLIPNIFTVCVLAHSETEHHKGMNHVHETKSVENTPSAPTIALSVLQVDKQDGKKHVTIKLTNIKDGSPVTPDQLKVVHTERIHLLIIDDSLEDYSHIHPKQTKDAGVYEFEWRPTKHDANYRMWADLLPFNTNVQEYVMADLTTSQGVKAQINRDVSDQSIIDGLTFQLMFDSSDLQSEKASMGKIFITDAKGNPVKSLDPIMGAFAHIVGFNEDFRSLIHIHPMGKEPTEDTQRGGPELQFHIEPEKPGFLKLFVQVKVDGKELFAPFGVMVRGSE